MNTTNLLLATTSILIVVAFGLSFQGFSDKRDDPENQQKIQDLAEQLKEMEAERRALEISQLRATRDPLPLTEEEVAGASSIASITPGEATSDLEDSERLELENTIKDLESALEEQTEQINEERNKIKEQQTAAARRVRMALDMGTVVSASKERGFIIYRPSDSAPTYQPGKILSVRRNSGILGEIQIDRLDPSGEYVATMRPQVFAPDGYPDIRPGDTIIDYRQSE
jgi:predicted RNase H-like nuclease (RuvC/YqgF family)